MKRTPLRTSPRAKLALGLILILAVVLRLAAAPTVVTASGTSVSPLGGGFDREMDGFQGSFFALTSVNYARLGVGAAGGYPIVNLDVDPAAPKTWYVYANHPPLLALLLWLDLELFGPAGWDTVHTAGVPPTSVEPGAIEAVLRTPMMLASLASILALFWALRGAMGEREALLGTLLYAAAPLAVLDAGLVNYEPPSILCAIVAFGAVFRYLEFERRRDLLFGVLALALGTAQTFAPLFFAVPLCLFVLQHRLRRRGPKAALRLTGLLAGAALLPILIHGAWARRVLEGIDQVPALTDRVRQLFGPMTSGEVPLFGWITLQFAHLGDATSSLFRDLVVAGLVFTLIDLLAAPSPKLATAEQTPEQTSQRARARAASFAALLFAGGFAVLFFYYRHTADGFVEGSSAQTTFMLNLLPGAAALAAVALFEVGGTLARVFQKGRPVAELSPLARHGPLVLVVAVALLTLGSFARQTSALHTAWRAPDPSRPLPEASGAELFELLPPGAVGLYPAAMGLTPAVSLYAWRTLLPVTPDIPSFQFTEARLAASGLTSRPRYLLLPTQPAESSRAAVLALEAFFQQMTPDIAAREPIVSPHWRAWLLSQ